MGFGRHKTSGEEETRQEATRISRFWKNKNEKTGAKIFHSPNKDVLAVGDCYSWEIKRKRKLLQWLSLPGGRLAELEQTEEVKSACINRKYETLIILTSRHNVEIVWNYVNKLFACKLAKPQWLQRNSLHLSQQTIRATDRIISFPVLLTTFAFAWKRTDYQVFRKRLSRTEWGRVSEERKLLTTDRTTACFLKARLEFFPLPPHKASWKWLTLTLITCKKNLKLQSEKRLLFARGSRCSDQRSCT